MISNSYRSGEPQSPPPSLVPGHVFQELFVGLCASELVDQELHRVDHVHRRKNLSQDLKTVQVSLFDQEVFLTSSGLVDVHTWEYPFFHQLAVEMDLRVTCTFELFEDDFIHA